MNFQDLGAYSVSKTALIGLTKVLSQSLIDENIRVNCIAPGVVKTKSSEVVSLNWLIYWEFNFNRKYVGHCWK